MNKKIKNTIIVFSMAFMAAFSLQSGLSAGELTAYQVMKKSDERNDGNTESSKSSMILIDKNGNQRVRQLKSYRKNYGKDTRSIIFFQSPADVRGTSFLLYDWDNSDRDDDNWLYLPALRKVKRIASSNKSGAFMGSDFTYSDLSGMKINNWDFKFRKKSEPVDGHDTWVITGKPKKSKKSKVLKETGYIKSQIWVRKDNFMVVKGKYWVKKGKKIKYFTAKDIKKVNGIWTAYKLQMITTKKGRKEHATVIKVWDVSFNKKLGNSMFTIQRMERGI